MPYEIIYNDKEGVVITKYTGVLSTAEFLECADKKFSEREITKTYQYSLSDLTDLTGFEVSSEALKYNASESKKVLDENQSGFMVVVAPDDYMFGMGRMWSAYAENNPGRAKIFRTRQEADDWISMRLAEASKVESDAD